MRKREMETRSELRGKLDPRAVAHAARLVAAAVDAEAGRLFSAVLAAAAGGSVLDAGNLARAAGLESGLPNTLYAVDRRFSAVFGFAMLDACELVDELDGRWTTTISLSFAGIVAEPLERPRLPDLVPQVDKTTTTWVAVVCKAARAGQGLHLALRCHTDEASRDVADFAGLVEAAGVATRAARVDAASSILRMELHASEPAVVLVGFDSLIAETSSSYDEDFYVEPREIAHGQERFKATVSALGAVPWLAQATHVYVWRVPHDAVLPTSLYGVVGGCIGPIMIDPEWARKTLDPDGMLGAAAAVLADTGDPRRSQALVATAKAVAKGAPMTLGHAASFVSRSLAPGLSADHLANEPENFDERLLVCEPETRALLARAEAVAAESGRILAFGASGGGKTTFAQVLALRMARAADPPAAVVPVTPGAVLHRGYGITENVVETLFSKAAVSGAILLIDELDALCGVRDESGSSSGNAYLVRALTDLWLRVFDMYPRVAVVATVNVLASCDAAVRRRFSYVAWFGDRLPPEAERLAWALLLKATPPKDWRPAGAAVADFAQARSQCRMLGVEGAAALARAVVRARDARLGLLERKGPIDRSVH